MESGVVVSGKRFLVAGTLLLLVIGAVGLGWVMAAEPQPADPAFWGTPTPTPPGGVLPFR
jgi:hypothetical protein